MRNENLKYCFTYIELFVPLEAFAKFRRFLGNREAYMDVLGGAGLDRKADEMLKSLLPTSLGPYGDNMRHYAEMLQSPFQYFWDEYKGFFIVWSVASFLMSFVTR